MSVIGGVRVVGTPKGGRSRSLDLDAATVAVLREHRKRQLAERLKAGPTWGGDDVHVFTTEAGAPVFPDTPSQLMPKLIARAGLPPMRLHDLRHLHATLLLLAGVPVHVVAERLGHAPEITMRVYARVLRQRQMNVAEVFAAAADGSC